MKILFCTDGTFVSNQAISNFHNWCNDTDIDIFCAADWTFLPENVIIDDDRFNTFCINTVNDTLDETKEFFDKNSIKYNKIIKMCGETVDCILEILQKEDYDAIVLGSHGKHGLDKWLGSVSNQITNIIEIPAFVSKEKTENNGVVFLIDNTEKSLNIIESTAKIINLENKDIFLVNVIEFPSYLFFESNFDKNWVDDIENKQETYGNLLLSKFEEKVAPYNVKSIKKKVLKKNKLDDVLKYFTEIKSNLVVYANSGKFSKYKLIFNPIHQKILEMYKKDILVLK